jgi:hypothetical protein
MNAACPQRVSLIIAGGLPAIPSPTIGVTTGDRPAVRRFGLLAWRPLYRLRQSLEGSPVHADRIEFTVVARQGPPVLRTGRSRSGALHPALRRGSSGSIPHGSSPHRGGLAPPYSPALSGARARASSPALSVWVDEGLEAKSPAQPPRCPKRAWTPALHVVTQPTTRGCTDPWRGRTLNLEL